MVQQSQCTRARSKELKTAPPREAVFQRKLIKKLRQIPNSFWFVKEAKSIRGLPDLIGVINGRPVYLECKRSISEAQHNTGRIVLQRKVLRDAERAGAYTSFIYPENEQEILDILGTL